MIGDSGTSTRRAALLIYAMAPSDQRWTLDQLAIADSSKLRHLLSELAELGIPRDRTLLKQVVAEHRAAQPLEQEAATLETPPGAGHAALAAALADAGPVRIADALRGEPLALIVMFLQCHDWTWREAFIRHLGPIRARAVKDAIAAPVSPAAPAECQRLLLAAVLRRVPALSACDPLAAAPAPALPLAAPAPHHPRRHWLKRLSAPRLKQVTR